MMKTAQATTGSMRQIRTLIVDDSPLTLTILAQFLAFESYFTLVGTATNGCQALRYAASMKLDLILMDYDLPHLNGIEAARNIKQFKNPPRIIIVTSDNSPNCMRLATSAGADGFVDKGGDLQAQLRSIFQELFQFSVQPLPGSEGDNSTGGPLAAPAE